MASTGNSRRRSARISGRNVEDVDLEVSDDVDDIFKDIDWNDLMKEATEPITELRRDFDNLNVKGKDGLNEFIKTRMPMAYSVLIGLRRNDKIDGMLLAIKANNVAAEAYQKNVEGKIEVEESNNGGNNIGNVNDSEEGSVDERKRKGKSKMNVGGQQVLSHNSEDDESDSDVVLESKKKGKKKNKGIVNGGQGRPTKGKGKRKVKKGKRNIDSELSPSYHPSDTGDEADVEDEEMIGKRNKNKGKSSKKGKGEEKDDFDEMAQLSAQKDRDKKNKNKDNDGGKKGKSKRGVSKGKRKKKRGGDEDTIDDIDSDILNKFENDLKDLGMKGRKKNKVM